MKKSLTLILVILIFSCSSRKDKKVKTDKSQKIIQAFNNLISNDIRDDKVNGSLSMVILKGNKILSLKSFGYSNPEKNITTDSTTIYRIGSITKSFTGFLLMQLHQEGILNLNDPIEKFLPEIKSLISYNEMPPITFKQLASHTSGLEREPRDREANSGAVEEWQNKVLKAIPKTSFRSKPTERYRYSNIGYAILGLAISRAAKMPYIKLVKKKILDPLKMVDTYFVVPKEKKVKLAKGMAGGPIAELNYDLPEREHTGRGYRVPNGGMYSTPYDMAKFMIACMGYSNLLNNDNLETIKTSQTPSKRLRANYSYGFQLFSGNELNTVGHGGSTPGYSAHFEFEKHTKYGVILMRNYNFGNTNFDLRSNALLRKLSKLE